MYDATDDPYCYPGTSILKNSLGLRTQAELAAFEAAITAQRADEPLPAGGLTVDHYRAIHRHLFQDVYAWAGDYRTIRTGRDGHWFCFPEYIDSEMRGVFAALADDNLFCDLDAEIFAARAAHFLAQLNAIHPFREGNGRAQNIFLVLLADRAAHPLDFERLQPEAMLDAMIASFRGDEAPLAAVILSLLRGPGPR